MITIETATVYKVRGPTGSRRFFTLEAAINRAAWQLITLHYGSDAGANHVELHRRLALHRRLTRFIAAGCDHQISNSRPSASNHR